MKRLVVIIFISIVLIALAYIKVLNIQWKDYAQKEYERGYFQAQEEYEPKWTPPPDKGMHYIKGCQIGSCLEPNL
jgi:hypothetical protein